MRTVLAVDAESDYSNDTDQYNKTFGVLHQDPRWWGTLPEILDISQAVRSFVIGRPGTPGLRKIRLTDKPVEDCYRVQGWQAPDPSKDPTGFYASRETQNYVNRLPKVPGLLQPNYFRG